MFWEVCTRRRNIFKPPSSRSVRILGWSVLLSFARPFLWPSHVTASFSSWISNQILVFTDSFSSCSSEKNGSQKKKVKTGSGRYIADPFHFVLQRRICSLILVFICFHFRSNEVTLNEVCIECFKGGVRDLFG
jgi:hypothetical protein